MAAGALGMAAVNLGFDQVAADANSRRQFEMQKKMYDISTEKQKEMGEFNQYLAKKWYTEFQSPSAMMKQLKDAGLNSALMYGGKGGGGASVATPQPGSVNAPTAAANYGNGGQAAAMGMGLQLELLKAQKENIEADTKNKEMDTTLKDQTQYSVGLQNAIENYVREFDQDGNRVELMSQTSIKVQQKIAELKIAAEQAIGQEITNRLNESQIHVNEGVISKMAADITQRAREITIAEGHLNIAKLLAEFNTRWENIIGKEAVQTIGQILQGLIKK